MPVSIEGKALNRPEPLVWQDGDTAVWQDSDSVGLQEWGTTVTITMSAFTSTAAGVTEPPNVNQSIHRHTLKRPRMEWTLRHARSE